MRNNDAALYYEVHQSTQEEAPILILLHGNGEDMHIFDKHICPLLPFYTVITMDTRNHGKSSAGEQPLSYQLFADDLFTLINKLQIGNFLILGFSDGANTALELALRHQERIAAMILVGANISVNGLTPIARKGLQLLSVGKSLRGVFSKGTKADKKLVRLMLEHPNIDPRQLEKITIPTLIITGEQDIIRDEHTELIASSLPKARRVVIPHTSHFVLKDAPEEFDRLVFEFLMEDD